MTPSAVGGVALGGGAHSLAAFGQLEGVSLDSHGRLVLLGPPSCAWGRPHVDLAAGEQAEPLLELELPPELVFAAVSKQGQGVLVRRCFHGEQRRLLADPLRLLPRHQEMMHRRHDRVVLLARHAQSRCSRWQVVADRLAEQPPMLRRLLLLRTHYDRRAGQALLHEMQLRPDQRATLHVVEGER